MKYSLNKIIVFLATVLAIGCAQMVGPTGGPRDSSPPKIVKSYPENFSVNYTGSEIKLYFNEFVQLKNLQTQLIVSPPLKELPSFRIKGKMLEISFRDTLHSNTTYNFQFGDGIVDITEGNALDSNLFVFSTGSFIDSLFVQGVVKNAFTLAPEKEVMVMLYSDFKDSVPYISNPKYFSKTKDDGSFKIQYVGEGSYKIFALKDDNGNYFFDLPDERIGFTEALVPAGDSSQNELLLFAEEIEEQFLKRGFAAHFGKLVFVFASPTKNARAVPLNRTFKKAWYIEELSEKKDSLIYWITGISEPDTLQMQVWENDKTLDTVEIIVPKREDPKEKKGMLKVRGQATFPQTLSLQTNLKPGQQFDLFSDFIIESPHPVKSYDVSEIILVEKEDTLKIKLDAGDKAMRKFYLKHQWKEGTDYHLYVPPQTFTDIFDLKNDTLQLSFKTRKLNEYGAIKLKAEFPKTSGQYIIQLMDMSEKVIKEKAVADNAENVVFENLFPGKYKMKLIFDANKNAKWDTGNYLKKQQPEKVIYYSAPIELRPKFDLELDWKVQQ